MSLCIFGRIVFCVVTSKRTIFVRCCPKDSKREDITQPFLICKYINKQTFCLVDYLLFGQYDQSTILSRQQRIYYLYKSMRELIVIVNNHWDFLITHKTLSMKKKIYKYICTWVFVNNAWIGIWRLWCSYSRGLGRPIMSESSCGRLSFLGSGRHPVRNRCAEKKLIFSVVYNSMIARYMALFVCTTPPQGAKNSIFTRIGGGGWH